MRRHTMILESTLDFVNVEIDFINSRTSLGRKGGLVPYFFRMSRDVHVAVVVFVAAMGLLSLGAQSSCSGVAAPKRAGEPCTRTSECQSGLACASGVCRETTDASSDGGTDQ